MNNSLTPPPEHDLRPATRERQREELIAIVAHEAHEGTPRRRLVPLAAAAAVLVLTAGLAVGVPALRGDDAQPPVSGADSGVAKPAVEPLSEKAQAAFATKCDLTISHPGKTLPELTGRPTLPPRSAKGPFTVVDGFRWVTPPATLPVTSWVTLRYSDWSVTCGFDHKGQFATTNFSPRQKTLRNALMGVTDGTYTREVTRITVAVHNGGTTEAVLRNGFFYAAAASVKRNNVSVNDPMTYVARAYDADGKLLYTSPQTDPEMQTELNSCYTDPEGKQVVNFDISKPKPPVDQCKRGLAWNW
ncbi:hypothetical protein [Kribbella sp. NPDC023855]|uniref:hypothetical protein n=1 Tax=Kribbella sp. NPDC023855 TaxID=3154698 RepID=UPI0033D5C75D